MRRAWRKGQHPASLPPELPYFVFSMAKETVNPGAPRNPTVSRLPPLSSGGEQKFWREVGADWRHLAGKISEAGYSFEWHEWGESGRVDWSKSFHPQSLEICLNLEGMGWVAANGARMEFGPETVGFFVSNGGQLTAERVSGQCHRFLSIEFSIPFLEDHLSEQIQDVHPVLRRCLASGPASVGISGVSPINHRQRDLLRSLLRPPVLRAAQRVWYQSKALEFAAEFLFGADGEEPFCTRAQRLAQERVARAKGVLLTDLEVTMSLEELGRKVGCSPFYLSRTFTQETGLTLSQWLRRARLEKAAELLRSGSCNVTEAALRVGYSSLSHFSQAFRETFGCCPGLYPLRTPAQQLPSNAGPEEKPPL